MCNTLDGMDVILIACLTDSLPYDGPPVPPQPRPYPRAYHKFQLPGVDCWYFAGNVTYNNIEIPDTCSRLTTIRKAYQLQL